MQTDMPKPILKWVGGKSQIIPQLMEQFPTEFQNYHEVFLGGGSVLFAFLTYVKQGRIRLRGQVFAYDINEPLIHVYKNIQHRHQEVYEILQMKIAEFRACEQGELDRSPDTLEKAQQCKENYYYWTRRQYNQLEDKTSPLGSALFIFLNKTCFRGVFRLGPNGFNVPYGHYTNPEIINWEHLEQVHQLIQPVRFECGEFHRSLAKAEPHDFVYLDPPYVPEKATSFVGYTEHGFPLEKHLQLFQQIHTMEAKILMSNADVPMVREHFLPEKYQTVSILCKRSIHSKKPEAKAKEVMIKN